MKSFFIFACGEDLWGFIFHTKAQTHIYSHMWYLLLYKLNRVPKP